MPTLQAKGILDGRGVLIARAPAQAEGLRQRLDGAGARVTVFPGIDIQPIALSDASRHSLAMLADADWAVFVSVNAVEHGLRAIAQQGGWPARLRAAAVGGATAGALEAAGHGPVLRPHGREDSEGLLANPGWGKLAGRQVVIFRGEGGREVLASGLRAAGAGVHYAEVYRRAPPALAPAPLRAQLLAGQVDLVCALSGEAIAGLFDALGADCHAALRAAAWLVPHPRVAAAARAQGIAHVVESAGSSDEALGAALSEFFSGPIA